MKYLQVGGLQVRVTDRKHMPCWSTFQTLDACKLLLQSSTTSVCHDIYILYAYIYIYFQKLQTRKGNCNYFLSLCTNTFTSLYSPQNVQWRTLDLSLHSSFVYTNTSASIYIIDMFVVKSCVLKQYRIYTGSFGSGHTLETN